MGRQPGQISCDQEKVIFTLPGSSTGVGAKKQALSLLFLCLVDCRIPTSQAHQTRMNIGE